eukprot:Nitzschia sp. Nitz4//scaffold47_size129522//60176//61372//NITZ4_003552-RA/size129522-processed-gene-0.139-mRNA-1//1//CDS//3329552803//3265//frame0
MSLLWQDQQTLQKSIHREQLGAHNEISLSPTASQVSYRWNRSDSSSSSGPSVLFLVKPDEALYGHVAELIAHLTKSGIEVLLLPSLEKSLRKHHNLKVATTRFETDLEFKCNRELEDEENLFLNHGNTNFPDLVCTVGGDGMLIHASMLFQGPIPPLLPISGGSMGFLAPFALDEALRAIEIALDMRPGDKGDLIQLNDQHKGGPTFDTFGLNGAISMTVRMRLDCRVVNPEGRVTARYNVLNEMVIDRGNSPYLATLECFCDDAHLTTVQGDGIMFATPTGSTAYSMSAGGSVVHPAVPAILVTPICPHVLTFRGMVFPDHVVLRTFVPPDARSPASVSFDGKYRQKLERGDCVQVRMSAYPVPTINRGTHSSDWLEGLKRSFNFNTRVRQKPLDID